MLLHWLGLFAAEKLHQHGKVSMNFMDSTGPLPQLRNPRLKSIP